MRGPNGGRLFTDGDLALELVLFESGIPPEFRVWVTEASKPVAPKQVDLKITLERLGGARDIIGFVPQGDYLRGDTPVSEPHSFEVVIEARLGDRTHRWSYESVEGRTRIDPDMARALGLETETAGPGRIREIVRAYGRIVPDRERVRLIRARFDGTARSVNVSAGEAVRRGQVLARVESNESLQAYDITAPISGVVTERNVNPGEQTAGRVMFTLIDTSSVWAELAVFPADRERVREGTAVRVTDMDGTVRRQGIVSRMNAVAEPNQSVLARVVLDNADGALVAGTFVAGEIEVAEHDVTLAVKRTALQSFRDMTVVFAQFGDDYEVRMLELGRLDDEWVEVLGGLAPGTRYVTANSYLVKADIEKAGAAHEH